MSIGTARRLKEEDTDCATITNVELSYQHRLCTIGEFCCEDLSSRVDPGPDWRVLEDEERHNLGCPLNGKSNPDSAARRKPHSAWRKCVDQNQFQESETGSSFALTLCCS